VGAADRALRATAFPFIGQVFGYNRTEGSDYNVSVASSLGDLAGLANNGSGTPAQDNMIRILRPQYGSIVAAYFSINFTYGATETNPKFKISISNVTSSTDMTPIIPTSGIDATMMKLFGNTNWITGAAGQATQARKVNLLPALPAPTDSTFRNECFVIGIHFPAAPVASGFSLQQFKLDMSGLMSGVQ
jgi:hypothetical protein